MGLFLKRPSTLPALHKKARLSRRPWLTDINKARDTQKEEESRDERFGYFSVDLTCHILPHPWPPFLQILEIQSLHPAPHTQTHPEPAHRTVTRLPPLTPEEPALSVPLRSEARRSVGVAVGGRRSGAAAAHGAGGAARLAAPGGGVPGGVAERPGRKAPPESPVVPGKRSFLL